LHILSHGQGRRPHYPLFRQLDRRKRIQERVLYIVRKSSLIGGAIHHVAHDFPGFFQQSVLQVIDRPGTNPAYPGACVFSRAASFALRSSMGKFRRSCPLRMRRKQLAAASNPCRSLAITERMAGLSHLCTTDPFHDRNLTVRLWSTTAVSRAY
jgi:hypothetical protein